MESVQLRNKKCFPKYWCKENDQRDLFCNDVYGSQNDTNVKSHGVFSQASFTVVLAEQKALVKRRMIVDDSLRAQILPCHQLSCAAWSNRKNYHGEFEVVDSVGDS